MSRMEPRAFFYNGATFYPTPSCPKFFFSYPYLVVFTSYLHFYLQKNLWVFRFHPHFHLHKKLEWWYWTIISQLGTVKKATEIGQYFFCPELLHKHLSSISLSTELSLFSKPTFKSQIDGSCVVSEPRILFSWFHWVVYLGFPLPKGYVRDFLRQPYNWAILRCQGTFSSLLSTFSNTIS